MSSTRSSWWLEKSTVTPAAARSARTCRMSSTHGGLASAVRTEESEDLAGGDVERQPVERDDRPVLAAQAVNLKLDRSHG
jgi:hypothetical protein